MNPVPTNLESACMQGLPHLVKRHLDDLEGADERHLVDLLCSADAPVSPDDQVKDDQAREEILGILIDAGLCVGGGAVRSADGRLLYSLLDALKSGRWRLAGRLIDEGVSPYDPLDTQHEAVRRIIICGLDLLERSGETPPAAIKPEVDMLEAVRNYDVQALDGVLEGGADPATPVLAPYHAIYRAITEDRAEVLALLLVRGVDLSTDDAQSECFEAVFRSGNVRYLDWLARMPGGDLFTPQRIAVAGVRNWGIIHALSAHDEDMGVVWSGLEYLVEVAGVRFSREDIDTALEMQAPHEVIRWMLDHGDMVDPALQAPVAASPAKATS
jgi:hypothetical protein